MNANLKAVFGCFIDKSLLKCLLVNDNVNNVKLSYDVIFYVTLFVAAIFFRQLFRLTGAKGNNLRQSMDVVNTLYDAIFD